MKNVKKYLMACSVLCVSVFTQIGAHAESADVSQSGLTQAQKVEKVREVFKAGKPLEMYNFVSKQREVIADPLVLTKEKAKEFLPPIPEIQQIFDIYAAEHPAYASLIQSYTDLQDTIQQGGIPGVSVKSSPVQGSTQP
jgi:hypothetical protein